MPTVELRREADLAYREAVPDGPETGAPVVLLHGFPESSRMWVPLMRALADAGRRCVAPDLYGLGDSADDAPATFEHNLEAFAAFHRDLDLGRVALVVHDWGGFIGLAWACEHPDEVEALVISDTGFFSDGRWHGAAEAIRGEQGEAIVAALDREGFAGLLRSLGGDAFGDDDIDAYWRPFEHGRGRRSTLEFYRSMDFEKLEPYQGKLAELGVPTLLLWGADDEFAPVAGGRRFEREIPGSVLVVVEGAGHFVFDQRPQRCSDEIAPFLGDRAG
jgi:haloalkane dehalogenase